MNPSTAVQSTTRYALTGRGRVVAVLVELDRRWPSLTEADQAEALELVARLAAIYRGQARPAPAPSRRSA